MIVYKNATTLASSTGTLSLVVPSDIADNQLMIACVGTWDRGNTVTTPSGWTIMASGAFFFFDSGPDEGEFRTYYRTASSETPSGTYDWTNGTSGGTADDMVGVMLTFTGAEVSVNPVDALSDFNDQKVTTTSMQFRKISTTVADEMLLAIAGWNDNDQTLATPDGYTSRGYIASAAANAISMQVFTTAATEIMSYGPVISQLTSAEPRGTRHLALKVSEASGNQQVDFSLAVEQQLNFRLDVAQTVDE
jgi:hypothetical protein